MDPIYQAWHVRRFELLTSQAQLDEFRRVARYPLLRQYILVAEAGTMCNEVWQLARMLTALPPVDVSPSPDPADNYLLAMAETGNADYLVTGDLSDLLMLRRHGKTQILMARAFVRLLKL